MATKKKSAKKKVQRPTFCACLWGLDPESPKGAIIREIFSELNVPVRTIKPTQLGDAVGSIAGLIGFRPSLKEFEGEAPLDEFILLNNLPQKTMQAFLAASRERDAVVDHKAIVTKFNKTWPLCELMKQIALEHAEIKAKEAAQQNS